VQYTRATTVEAIDTQCVKVCSIDTHTLTAAIVVDTYYCTVTPQGRDCKEQVGQFGVTELDVLPSDWKPIMTEPTKYDADIIKIWYADS
jgi:hypothetical protein